MLSDSDQGSHGAETDFLFDTRYQTIIDALPEGLAHCRIVFDSEGTPVDWVFLAVNRAFRALFNGADPVGMTGSDFLPAITEGSPPLIDGLRQVVVSGEFTASEYYAARLDKWVHISASSPSPGHLLALVSDISERTRIQKSLRVMQLSIDGSPDLIHWSDAEGRTVYANPAMCAALGYTIEEFRELYVWDFDIEATRELYASRFRANSKSGTLQLETTLRGKRGDEIKVTTSVVYLLSEGTDLVINFFRDITEHRRIGNSLITTQDTVDQSPDMVHWLDRDGRIVYANKAMADCVGYSRQELQSMYVWDLTPDVTPTSFGTWWGAGEARSPVAHESVWSARDGRRVPVEISSYIVATPDTTLSINYGRDVTARKEAEDALQESQRMLRLVLDTVPMSITWKDSGLRYLGCNTAVADQAGLSSPDQIVGLAQADIPALGLSQSSLAADLEVLSTGLPKLRYEEVLTPPDRPPRRVQGSKVPLRGRDGRVFGVLDVHEDVTDRHRMLQTLRERDDQLRQSQKMEAVGRLAGGIAHDFNNVVTTIIGYSDLLLATPEVTPKPLFEDVREIRAAAERARTLTRQILAFSRRQALEPKVLSLTDVIGETERLLARTIGADIDLKVDCAPDLGQVEVDEHEFVQVLLNLAVNARDAMPSGGTLTVRTANVDLSEEFCETHPDAQPGRHVLVTMTDTGSGMDGETAARVFEPFFTTKPAGQGTGLGLSMVYGVVAQSGGCIYVESEPGTGSSFYIYLPRYDQTDATEGSTADKPDLPPCVLVVDDDATFRTVTVRMLEKRGFRVLSAVDGDQAVDMLADRRRKIDLLLTDVVLPGGLQGVHVAQQASSLRPGLPILYMSAYSRDSIVSGGRLRAGEDYLEKPFTAEHLVTHVREMLHDRSVQR